MDFYHNTLYNFMHSKHSEKPIGYILAIENKDNFIVHVNEENWDIFLDKIKTKVKPGDIIQEQRDDNNIAFLYKYN